MDKSSGGGVGMYKSSAPGMKANDPATKSADFGKLQAWGSNANVSGSRLNAGSDMKWKGKRSSYRGKK